jgi:hypothetical protein
VVVQGLSAPSALEAAVARHLETETVPAALEEARLKRLEEEITAIEQKVDEVLRLGAASALAQQRAEKLLQELDARHAVLGKERDELLQRLRAPGQATVSWQTTLSQYRRWLQGATWSDAGVGPLPTPATAEQGDLLALDPPARLYPLLLALRQKIVRDVVEKVVVDPAGAGAVYLRGNVIGVPITVSAIPAKMRNRRPLVQPVLFEVAEPSDSSSGEGD